MEQTVVAMADEMPVIDHAGLTVVTFEVCLLLLRSRPVGRVAFTQNGDVEILPVNYCVLDTSIGFRTADGSKLGAALQGKPVAFEVDDFDPVRREGWSVVVKGRAELVVDEAVVSQLEATHLTPWADAVARPQWVLIRADGVSGRRIEAHTS